MINEAKINPNLSEVYDYFDNIIKKYFENGKPVESYFEQVSCYNCGSHEVLNEFTVNRFRHVRCRVCGMVYVNPRLKEDITHDFYGEEDYSAVYRMKLVPSIDYRRNVLAINKYRQIMQHFTTPGKVLDIGCGLGEVLSVFREHGWDCTGIEFNAFAAGYAREKFNLEVINRSIYDFDISGKYDLIMLWGVLEHFYDPSAILQKIHSILNDDGLLVLEVPSADSVLVRYHERTGKPVDRIIEGDRHIMLFSIRGFEEMCGKAGFVPESILSNGLDISTLNRLELGGSLDLDQVNTIQKRLDDSLQGDLLRGFFKKRQST